MKRAFSVLLGGLGGVWLVAVLAGCGETEFGMRVTIPGADRVPLGQVVDEGVAVRLPERGFNVYSRRSAQTPGAIGRARGDSDAQPAGRAFCSAEAADGGAAWGEFQLGHAMVGADGVAVRMTVKLAIEYAHFATAVPVDARDTLAEFVLKVYLKDGDGRVLHREVLAALSSDDGSAVRSGTAMVEFDAVLAAGRGYDLVVAGRASVTSEPEATAEARIEIKQLTAELTCVAVGSEGS